MFFSKAVVSTIAVALMASLGVAAESHTVKFNNKCGRGTPKLIHNGNVLSNGADHTVNGPLAGAIAYLQTGNCGFNGESCTLLEITLKNPTSPGAGSSVDVSLIAPHKFSVATGFYYVNGCNGVGNRCGGAGCCPSGAFCKPDDYQAQRQCEANNVDLMVTFC